jgi:hypothetical protein
VVGGITYERSHHSALSRNVAPAAWAPDGGSGASRRAGACRPSPPTTSHGPGEVDADMHPVVWVCLLLFDTEGPASASPFFWCFHGKPFFSMALSTREVVVGALGPARRRRPPREMWAMTGFRPFLFKGRKNLRPSIRREAPTACHLWTRRILAAERETSAAAVDMCH